MHYTLKPLVTLLQHCFCFLFFFFFFWQQGKWDLSSQLGTEPTPTTLEGKVSTFGLPSKSWGTLCFNKTSRDSDAGQNLRTTDPGI